MLSQLLILLDSEYIGIYLLVLLVFEVLMTLYAKKYLKIFNKIFLTILVICFSIIFAEVSVHAFSSILDFFRNFSIRQ